MRNSFPLQHFAVYLSLKNHIHFLLKDIIPEFTKSANVFRLILTKSANVFLSFLTKSENVQYLISLRHAKSLHRNADFLHIQNFQSIPQNAAANNATGDFNKRFIYSKLWSHTCTASAQSLPQAYHSHHKRELAPCNNTSCLFCRRYWYKCSSFS